MIDDEVNARTGLSVFALIFICGGAVAYNCPHTTNALAVTPALRDGGLFAATECLRYPAEVGKPPLLRLLTNGLCGHDISRPYVKI